jgi:antitoxin component of RelBE/YafQ-DinJ toxin-antitoxin module
MSQTIYARVPDHVKEAADAHASSRGMTLANAVSELLDLGLQATADARSIGELERRNAELTAEVEHLRLRDHAVSSAYQALAQRTAQPVGLCPECGNRVSGHDLLVRGSCPDPECGASLAPLLSAPPTAKPTKGSLDDGEFKLLLGALGVALGIAYITQQAGGR